MSTPRALPRTLPARARCAVAAVALALGIGTIAGCASDEPSLGASGSTLPHQSSSAPVSTTSTTPLTELPTGPENVLGFIATPKGAPVVFTEPDETSAPIDVPATTDVGAPTTFAVIGNPERTPAAWYKVMLPTRPNDATGWVQAASVDLTKTEYRLFIDLEGRKLTVERGDATYYEAPIAIGTEDNPTPTGPAYLIELIENVTPDDAYGPYAFGLSIHSDQLTEFAGGDGRVGIHGTNQPQLIGERVSHGCVRLNNDDIRRLVDMKLPLGAPVFVT